MRTSGGCRDPRHVGVWVRDILLDLYNNCGAAKVVTSAMDNEGTRVTMETGYKIVPVE